MQVFKSLVVTASKVNENSNLTRVLSILVQASFYKIPTPTLNNLRQLSQMMKMVGH